MVKSIVLEKKWMIAMKSSFRKKIMCEELPINLQHVIKWNTDKHCNYKFCFKNVVLQGSEIP